MKAVVWHGVGEISVDQVADPVIQDRQDAVVRITRSAICGTDLHFVRGTFPGMKPGTILGHEAIGVVEETGREVRNFSPGNRVVIPSTIACGSCGYCRAGYYAQCDNANPHGREAGTAFYGDPEGSGPSDELSEQFAAEREKVVAQSGEQGGQWVPGDAPSQAQRWAVEAVAKAGTLGVIGVYPPQFESFPLCLAMNKNLTVRLGNCHHRRYVPGLLSRIASGGADPATVLTRPESIDGVLDAYRAFDRREPGWTKVTLEAGG